MGARTVIVIGAGAAGLTAARALAEAGREVVIVEARDRVGGRIHTIVDEAFPSPVELGAEFVHGRPRATWDVIEEAGLVTYDVPFRHHRRRAGRLLETPDFDEDFDRVMGGLRRLRRDMSFAEYVRRHHAGTRSAEAVQAALDFVQGFDAADPERISALSLAREQEELGDVADETQFRLLRGYGALAAHLLEACVRRGVVVHLRTSVREVQHGAAGVHVVCTDLRGREQVFSGEQAVVTLPLGILQAPPGVEGAVRFTPDVPRKRAAAARLGFGPVVKAIVKLREPVWESADTIRAARGDQTMREASFFHDRLAPFPTWWTMRPLRLPVLTGWAGGPRAAALGGMSREALRARAVESLAMLFRRRRRTIEGQIEAVHVVDWAADPLARGAYSYEAVGAGNARRELGRPVGGVLFFAGEATDAGGQASTVAGAIASGRRAAAEALASRRHPKR